MEPLSRYLLRRPVPFSRLSTSQVRWNHQIRAQHVKDISALSPQGNFMSVRRFKVQKPATVAEITELCDKEFVPLISRHPDFVAYYAMKSDEDEYFSVSVFSSQKGAQESLKMAADWTSSHFDHKVMMYDHVEGQTVVHFDQMAKMQSDSSQC
eukprot:TRINITY_DN6030_c0_g1_i3.p1 TRINITY_DN6030_c0_g1~~TRINITY_DN6030_c0_g1_i3.p1  ORF type:complete len:153 (-),score=14.28 TRINITY_DN6030_c0_g1_i3:41-499(-)